MFTLIAHKSSSADYCRGCLMASYSSDFYIHNGLEQEKLIDYIAEILFNNSNLQCNEEGYEFYVLDNGVTVYYSCHNMITEHHYPEDDAESPSIDSLILQKAQEQCDLRVTAAKKEKEEELKLAVKKNKEAKEREEKALFDKLKKKFEG